MIVCACRYEFAISGWAEAMKVEEPAGEQLFLEILQNAEDHSIIVQIQAGFMDVAQIIESHPDLFEGSVMLCYATAHSYPLLCCMSSPHFFIAVLLPSLVTFFCFALLFSAHVTSHSS